MLMLAVSLFAIDRKLTLRCVLAAGALNAVTLATPLVFDT
jgi:hypothetical protein